MKSRYSLPLGKPFGIRVAVHWTFSLLIAWIVIISLARGLALPQVIMHIFFVLALFVCVVLHELGHSLAAIRLGGEVSSITLLPIGGMAHLSRMPEKPRDEFLVSAAGPLVNVVIAILLWIYLVILQRVDIDNMEFHTITRQNFALMLMAANLFIVVFNLIPAFPMDGGRLFRSALSMRLSRLKATRIAKDIGQIFAVFFIIAGLFFNPFLVVIGFFILLGAKGEYEMIKYQEILRDATVDDIVKTEYAELDEDSTLGEAAEKLVHISDNGFVINSDGEFAGILTKNDLINGLSKHGKATTIKEVLLREPEKVETDTPLFNVYQDMQRNRKYLMPVFDRGQFKGVLDLENLHEFFLIRKATQ